MLSAQVFVYFSLIKNQVWGDWQNYETNYN